MTFASGVRPGAMHLSKSVDGASQHGCSSRALHQAVLKVIHRDDSGWCHASRLKPDAPARFGAVSQISPMMPGCSRGRVVGGDERLALARKRSSARPVERVGQRRRRCLKLDPVSCFACPELPSASAFAGARGMITAVDPPRFDPAVSSASLDVVGGEDHRHPTDRPPEPHRLPCRAAAPRRTLRAPVSSSEGPVARATRRLSDQPGARRHAARKS